MLKHFVKTNKLLEGWAKCRRTLPTSFKKTCPPFYCVTDPVDDKPHNHNLN